MDEMLMMIVGKEATIKQMDLLGAAAGQLQFELAEFGYEFGQPVADDPEIVKIPLSPTGLVTSMVSESSPPFVSFQIAGTNVDVKRVLRNVGAYCSRTFGVVSDVS